MSEKSLAKEKAEDQIQDEQDVLSPEKGGASKAQIKAAAKGLPVYDEVERIKEAHKLRGNDEVVPDTPSGYAVKKVGNLDGEDVDHSKIGATEAARLHGETYQYYKALLRWGPGPQPPSADD